MFSADDLNCSSTPWKTAEDLTSLYHHNHLSNSSLTIETRGKQNYV